MMGHITWFGGIWEDNYKDWMRTTNIPGECGNELQDSGIPDGPATPRIAKMDMISFIEDQNP